MSETRRSEPNEYYKAGFAAAFAGEPWPQRPTWETPFREQQFWKGYQAAEAERRKPCAAISRATEE